MWLCMCLNLFRKCVVDGRLWFFFFKQKTAYEMRISDWSSDVCSSDLMTSATLNYIVLGVAFLMEGTSWYLALREFSASKGRMRWWPAIRHSKDPANFIVLFEDSAALAGLVVAPIGVWTSHYFNDPRLDGLASIILDIILPLVAPLPAPERNAPFPGGR